MDTKLSRGITTRGNSIVIAFTFEDKRYRETLSIPPTNPNLKYATRKRESILFEIASNNFDYISHFPNSKKALELKRKSAYHYLIKDALNDWLKRTQTRIERSTLRGYLSAVNYYLIPQFGEYTLSELTASDVKNWISTLQISNKRINNTLIPLRQIFDDAFHDEIIERNPMTRVKNLKLDTKDPNPFSLNEIDKILNALTGTEKNLIKFAFFSGLRTSELIALKWTDIDFKKNVINVSRACVYGKMKAPKTKSGIRSIQIRKSAKTALLAQKDISADINEFVFIDPKSNDRWANDQAIRKRIWMPALKRADIKYRNPYQTRHTFASQELMNGTNPMKLAYEMGHSDWGMIRNIYGKYINED